MSRTSIARQETERPFVAKSEMGFLVLQTKERISFPSKRRSQTDALFELIAVKTYAQALSFMLDYGVPFDDIDYKLTELRRWAEPAGSEYHPLEYAYKSTEPLLNPSIAKGIPFCYEAAPGNKSAARELETACVDIPTFFEEALNRMRVAQVATANTPPSWSTLRRDEAERLALSFLEKSGRKSAEIGYLQNLTSNRASAQELFYHFQDLDLDGREHLLKHLGDVLTNEVRTESVEQFIQEALIEERLLSICQGITISDFVMYRDFFRTLLTLFAIADADEDDLATISVLNGLFEWWIDAEIPLLVFHFPGLENQGIFLPCFEALDVENPFINCSSLPPSKGKKASSAFRAHFSGDVSHIKSNGNLVVFPLDQVKDFADEKTRIREERAHASEIARFALGLYRSNKLTLPKKGDRLLASGKTGDLTDVPLIVNLFEAACEIDATRAQTARGGRAARKGTKRVTLCPVCHKPAYPGSKYCFGDSCKSRTYQASSRSSDTSSEP